MSEFKGTPGPWSINTDSEYACPRIDAPNGRAVASAVQRDPHPALGHGISAEQAMDNARLIAAAPELFTALLDCVHVMERDLNGLAVVQPELKQARAALSRAGLAPKCATCNDNGMIGGPSYYAPDEGGDPCPDCAVIAKDTGESS